VCVGREANGKATSYYRDRNWDPLPYDRETLNSERHIAHPPAYEEMISAAERLSVPFPFVRVDFYCIQGRAVLGEMTFTPSACIDRSHTELATRVLGEMIVLPRRYPDPAGYE
jgi:hypothetical protein